MASGFAGIGAGDGLSLVERLVAADGSRGHAWPIRLAAAGAARRDLADAVHALCAVHGHQPGMADDALAHLVQPEAAGWLGAAATAFAGERAALATLVAAAGPLPSTPGQAESEAALLAQRRALAMLAASDRGGCAAGAVAALLLDWPAVRGVLDRAAAAFGAGIALADLPHPAATADAIGALATGPARERAVAFGTQQLLAQHRALWSLLEARAEARR